MRSVATATVKTPIDQVWASLADHEGMASWAPGLKVTLTREGRSERNGVGAVRKIDAPGPAPAIVEEITRFEPGQGLGYKATGGVPLKNYRGDVDLAQDGTGTRISWAISADQRVPFVEKAVTKAIATVLLKAFVRAVSK
ncbi:SRPBCC family protein [Nocardioides stalactiti]|uniref:SRPBCC family protein n=1 Tax=Nocardioides stalactiti TaxID=2755356 RepID=UPI0016047E70|nr:SRPBCC family protein [Nocardioides stalactiti]